MMTATDKTIVIPVEGGEDSAAAPAAETIESREEQAAAELADKLLRLQAEFSNYKRRTEQEWASVKNRSKGELAEKILPVLDDFERLLSHHQEDDQVDRQGVSLIVQKLLKALTDEGLEAVPAVGEHFDPEVHQAIAVEEVDSDQDETVVEEWQRGYRFKERLLRPSQVKVGRHNPA